MNGLLLEFFGPDAPQPSVLAWSTFWMAVFIFRNAELNIEFERLRSWVIGKQPYDEHLKEIRELRQQLSESTKWLEEEIHASNLDERFARERKDDVG